MSDIAQINNSALDALSPRARSDSLPKENELGQDAFLQLLVTQLSNQDPLSPQENGEFIAQLAQFSSVEGIQNLNSSFESMAGSLRSNQALQASALVGRSIRLPSESAELRADKPIEGSASLPLPTEQVEVRIYDQGGQLVNREVIRNDATGLLRAGEIPLAWDGQSQDGIVVAPGTFRFEVEALIDGEPQRLATQFNSNVNSVTLEQNNEVTLNVAGAGTVPLSQVKEIF